MLRHMLHLSSVWIFHLTKLLKVSHVHWHLTKELRPTEFLHFCELQILLGASVAWYNWYSHYHFLMTCLVKCMTTLHHCSLPQPPHPNESCNISSDIWQLPKNARKPASIPRYSVTIASLVHYPELYSLYSLLRSDTNHHFNQALLHCHKGTLFGISVHY